MIFLESSLTSRYRIVLSLDPEAKIEDDQAIDVTLAEWPYNETTLLFLVTSQT